MSEIEIRTLPDDESPDEIILHDVKVVHFEYMNDGHVWCGLTLSDGRIVHVNLFTKRSAKILTRCEVNV